MNISDPAPANAAEPKSAVRMRGVRKVYKIYEDMVSGPIKEALFFWRKKSELHTEFVAVEGLDLEIPKGQVVGILGRNGSGKTTVLKMIAGLLTCDDGTIEVDGRVSALLAIGVGVNSEFSGRENIYYTGMLLGMSRTEILAKMDDIIEFAEIGDFIDRPFRTYSTGMKARLLFSVSMSLNPEILIVDEALSAGDIQFVAKCNAKMKALCRSGVTVLLVSHNLLQIQELADRVIVLDGGRLVADGKPAETIARYHHLLFEANSKVAAARARSELPLLAGSGEALIVDAALTDGAGRSISSVYTGDPMTLTLTVESEWPVPRPVKFFLGIDKMPTKEWVCEIHSDRIVDPKTGEVHPVEVSIGRRARIAVSVPNSLLLNGHYAFWLILMDENLKVLCEYRGVAPFFASRRAYSHLIDAVFVQPCTLEVNNHVGGGA